ncbi:MAG: sensor histidine kinase [Victivallaceae bacterium]
MTTAFASAERATPVDIVRQVKIFQQDHEFCSLLDLMPDFILILNVHRQAVYANSVLLRFLGKTNIMDIAGLRPGEILNCIHWLEDGYDGCGTTGFCKVCGAVNAILTSLHKMDDVQECSVTTGDRQCFNFRVWTSPYPKNNEDFVLFILRDISVEKYHSALQHVFFHDILNTVSGFYGLQAVVKDYAGNLDEFAELFQKHTDRLHEEITSHREMMLAETGDIVAESNSISSMNLLNDIIQTVSALGLSRTKTIKIDSYSENINFVSDVKLLGRVLGNMIKNALEASDKGDEIIVGCRVREDKICFSVHNSQAIDPDVQLSIFQRSFSTRGTGRGWGTYSMKLLSENILNGKVYFESNPQDGTTFYAEYPLNITGKEIKKPLCL